MLEDEKKADPPAEDTSAFDTYKLEYEQASARYENIYKAVWQNFSYMALVSGAILTFGKDALGVLFAACLACHLYFGIGLLMNLSIDTEI